MSEIKEFPQTTTTYQLVHLDDNNKVIFESHVFEYLSEAREFANKNKTYLGYGEVKWRIVSIDKSLLDVNIEYK